MGKSSGSNRNPTRQNGNNAALEEYISGDGMWINNWLRNKQFELNNSEKTFLNALDKATDSTIGNGLTLYRSVDASAIFGKMTDSEYDSLRSVFAGDTQKYNVNIANKILSRVPIGSIKKEKGFMSTTKSKSIAEDWGGFSGSSKPIILKIKTSKNTKGADLSKHRMGQKEILLKRGAQYKIKKIYSSNGQIYVDVTMI